jgi:hypothetical protein
MSQPKPQQPLAPEWLELVEKHIASIRFGTVQLTVHDSKVVQIETTEKVRLDKPPGAKSAR